MRLLPASALLALATALAAAPASAGPLAPLLVEVHPDPEGADLGREWFELANPGPSDLALDGWAVTDGDACLDPQGNFVASWALPLDGLVVPAGGRVAVPIQGTGGCLRLANAADHLALLGPGGHEVQRVAWGAGGDAASPAEGLSVAACSLAANLHGAWGVRAASRGGPNPGCARAVPGAATRPRPRPRRPRGPRRPLRPRASSRAGAP